MKNTLRAALLLTVIAGMTLTAIAAKTGADDAAWLGVYTQTIDKDIADVMDLTTTSGVIVNEVVEDSPADEAGLREDDIIVDFDGARVNSTDELTDMVREKKVGDKVTLTIIRKGQEKKIDVTLGSTSSQSEYRTLRIKPGLSDKMVLKLERHSYIGVSLLDLSVQLGDYFGVKDGEGALISNVEEKSPAAEAGLKAGDVIVAIDSENILDPGDVTDIIRDAKPGEKADVTVIRSGRQQTIAVTIGETEEYPVMGDYNLSLPDLPAITVPAPRTKGLYRSYESSLDRYFDAAELQQQLDELRDQIRELKRQVEELNSEGQ